MMVKAPIFIYNSFNRGFATGITGYSKVQRVSSCILVLIHMCMALALWQMSNIRLHRIIVWNRCRDDQCVHSLWQVQCDHKAIRIQAIQHESLVLCAPHLVLHHSMGCVSITWTLGSLCSRWGKLKCFKKSQIYLLVIPPSPVISFPEGYLTSCTFDYLTDTFDNHLFVAVIFTCSYVFPMSTIIYYYSQIVSHVVQHEKTLREQAKKMNVESLRSNQGTSNESAEIRIAKAAITICFLFVASWTPYGVLSLIGAFGDSSLLTPSVTMIPACTCKLVACLDPYVYAISHPKYRIELQKKLPWLNIIEKPINGPDNVSNLTEMTPEATTVN